jgi:hypothetical protein
MLFLFLFSLSLIQNISQLYKKQKQADEEEIIIYIRYKKFDSIQ